MSRFQVKQGGYNSPYYKDMGTAMSYASRIKGETLIRTYTSSTITLDGISYVVGILTNEKGWMK